MWLEMDLFLSIVGSCVTGVSFARLLPMETVKLSTEWGWISGCGSVCLTAEVWEKWRMPCRTRLGSLCWEVGTNTGTRIGCAEVEDIYRLFTHIWRAACLGTSTLTSLSVK